MTQQETLDAAAELFDRKAELVTLVARSLQPGRSDQEAKFVVNLQALKAEFANIPYFDESLRYYGPALNIVGGRSRQYDFSVYNNVFPN